MDRLIAYFLLFLCIFLSVSCQQKEKGSISDYQHHIKQVDFDKLWIDSRVDSLLRVFIDSMESYDFEESKKYTYEIFIPNINITDTIACHQIIFSAMNQRVNDERDLRNRCKPLFYISYKDKDIYIYSGIEAFFLVDGKNPNPLFQPWGGRVWSCLLTNSKISVLPKNEYSYYYSTPRLDEWEVVGGKWHEQIQEWKDISFERTKFQTNIKELLIDERLKDCIREFIQEGKKTESDYLLYAGCIETLDSERSQSSFDFIRSCSLLEIEGENRKLLSIPLFYFTYNGEPVYIYTQLNSVLSINNINNDPSEINFLYMNSRAWNLRFTEDEIYISKLYKGEILSEDMYEEKENWVIIE